MTDSPTPNDMPGAPGPDVGSTDTAAKGVDPADTQETDSAPPSSEADGPPADREAAKYRVRAKEAEAARDRATERLTIMQRVEAERLATGAGKLVSGEDLWSAGTKLEELLDDEGNLSTELVTNAVAAVLDSRPHWRQPATSAAPASTVTSSDKIDRDTRPTFTDAFKPRDRR